MGERLLGLDIGGRRIGVAVSDEMGMIASPVAMIARQSDVAGQLKELVARYNAAKLIAGLPVGLSGREGPQAAEVRAYTDALALEVGVPVEYWDERLSTSIAEQSLIAQGTRRNKRKERVDAVAAAVILQSYLENQRWKLSTGRR
ncbi:MAG TPA: Holliday junction resolvase RuvX [Thermomicrobiales bacterium]|nr:Holliday junction resolvase RuvX [Thermomicrobiales bacterium]